MRILQQLVMAGLVTVALAGDSFAAAAAFAPHRVVYGLTLDRAKTDMAVSRASGELAVEWRQSCAGWTFEYRSVIDIGYSEGGRLVLATNASSWEDIDGREFRFNVRHKSNGRVIEEIEGHATLGKTGGTATFVKPAAKRIKLPPGTLFPVAHSLEVLRAAGAGPAPVFLARQVFDGMDSEGAYLVNAVIGKGGPSTTGPQELRGMMGWPVHLGYFANSSAPDPRFELGMRLLANGVTDDLIMALSEITLRGQIQRLELLPDGCPG